MISGKILVTGATGLIGKSLIKRLLQNNSVSIIAVVRDKEKAIRLFGPEDGRIKYLISDVNIINPIEMGIDYVIHAASQTSSKAFIEEPVETILTSIQGTKNLLEIAMKSRVKGFVYLSSMEVYGNPLDDEKITENHGTDINTMKTRSCYPESKRLCETLCTSYASEYGVPAMVLRLAQTFGPGVEYNDSRVFAEFARCVIENRDIVLHTKGETKRSYLYTEDAVDAILTVLEKGRPGEAYNVANETTYCSIFEMACMVIDRCSQNSIRVRIEEKNIEKIGYAPKLCMNLDTTKICALGWKSKVNLEEMYKKMIASMSK